MLKKLLLTTAIASLLIANTATAAPTQMSVDTPEFNYDAFDIDIFAVAYVDSFREEFGTIKTAEEGSVFVALSMKVKNTAPVGKAFSPQADIKLLINGETYDAENIDFDGHWASMENIEPNLTKKRFAYFEIPSQLRGQPFTFRFQSVNPSIGPSGDYTDIRASSQIIPAPTPASTPVVTPRRRLLLRLLQPRLQLQHQRRKLL